MLVSGIFNVEMTVSLYKSRSGLWIFCLCIPEAAWPQRSRVWVVSLSAVVDPRFSLLMQSVGKRKQAMKFRLKILYVRNISSILIFFYNIV